MKTNEIRITVDDSLHTAVKIIAESAEESIDRWVGSLIRAEVTKHFALARRLTSAVSEKDLLRVECKPPLDVPKKLYFIQRGEAGPIKIGVAADAAKRLFHLQTACAEELRILKVTDQIGDITERKLHRKFRRLQHGGEWFSPDTELLALILSLPSIEEVSDGERKVDGK